LLGEDGTGGAFSIRPSRGAAQRRTAHGTRHAVKLAYSMIPKSGCRFLEKIMLEQ